MEENEKRKDLLIRIAMGVAAVLLLAGIVYMAMHLIHRKADITEGRSLLNKLNSVSVSTVKAEIKEIEKSEAEERANQKLLSHSQRFADAVIIGDSSVQGLIDHCQLNRVLAVSTAQVGGVEKESFIEVSVQTPKKSSVQQARPAQKSSSDNENMPVEGEYGVHNNYGIEGTVSEEEEYEAGDALTLDGFETESSNENTEQYGYYDEYGNYIYTDPNAYNEYGEYIGDGAADEATVSQADPVINSQMLTAIKANPSKVFLSFGLNDIARTNGDVNACITSYQTVLSVLEEKLPESDLYVIGVLPVRQDVSHMNQAYESIDAFNEKLKSLCRDMHVTFIETEELVNSSDYAEDGISFTEAFYPRFLELIEEIGDM